MVESLYHFTNWQTQGPWLCVQMYKGMLKVRKKLNFEEGCFWLSQGEHVGAPSHDRSFCKSSKAIGAFWWTLRAKLTTKGVVFHPELGLQYL